MGGPHTKLDLVKEFFCCLFEDLRDESKRRNNEKDTERRSLFPCRCLKAGLLSGTHRQRRPGFCCVPRPGVTLRRSLWLTIQQPEKWVGILGAAEWNAAGDEILSVVLIELIWALCYCCISCSCLEQGGGRGWWLVINYICQIKSPCPSPWMQDRTSYWTKLQI